MSFDTKTIWYMGAKTRILPDFIEGAVRDLVEPGARILDLCTGTAIVARRLASRHPIDANDVQLFSASIASAHLEGPPEWLDALEYLDPEADLEAAYQGHFNQLVELAPKALETESRLLSAVVQELSTKQPGEACREYRHFVAATPLPVGSDSEKSGVDARVSAEIYSPLAGDAAELGASRQRDPQLAPYLQTLLYHGNIYFGWRQAMSLDSFRFAIDSIPASDPLRERKRTLYLAALLYAASTSTSGTSHFAQPRSLEKDSELLAVSKRRLLDIEAEFAIALDRIRREWGERKQFGGNRVFRQPAESLLGAEGPYQPGDLGGIYLDPPYTADNYSRFYHVLETLVEYNYPALELRGGRLTRGRYPQVGDRFQSDFCRSDRVEAIFRWIAERARALGTKLLVSYSSDSGLLLKRWRSQGEENALFRFRKLFRESFGTVEIRERELMHSGQGDSNKTASELLVLCEP